MTRADPNRALVAFEKVFLPWMRTRVRAIHVAGAQLVPQDRPLLFVANHASWWDGFLLRAVQRITRPSAHFVIVMEREQLERFTFFRRLGAVGIEPGSARSTVATINELRRRVRNRPDTVVTFFPQGRIWPSTRRPLGFLPGVELFARRMEADVVPLGLHLEPLKHVSPTAFLSVGPPHPPNVTAAALEEAVEAEIDAILAHLGRYGEDGDAHWPPPGGRLPRARTPQEVPL